MAQRQAYTQWIKRGTHAFMPSDNIETVDKLDSGVYSVTQDSQGNFELIRKDVNTDLLIDIPQPEAVEIMDAIESFYSQREKFEKWGFIFKRGFLLYGVPGGGKTSIISKIVKYTVDKLDGIVFMIYNKSDLAAYAAFMNAVYRTIEPDRSIVVVFEDIDGLCNGYDTTETLLINVLDGIGNNSNVLNIATTNYTERLSDRVIKRPNRFDRKIEIKSPTEEARRFFFDKRLLDEYKSLPTFNLDEWVRKTDGMTMAQLGELVKSVCVLDHDLDATVEVLTGKRPPSSDYYNKPASQQSVGFTLGAVKKAETLVKAADDVFDAALIGSGGIPILTQDEAYEMLRQEETAEDKIHDESTTVQVRLVNIADELNLESLDLE